MYKRQTLLEISIYVLVPIFLGSILWEKLEFDSIILTLLIVLLYTIVNKLKSDRFNISGVLFSCIYLINMFFKYKATSDYDIFVNNLYLIIGIGMLLSASILFGKNLCRQLFIDIFKSLQYNSYNIYNIIKKYELNYDFNRFAALFILHILVISLIKIYALSEFGKSGYTTLGNLEILGNSLFLISEFVLASAFYNKIKNITNTNYTIKSVDPRIIYFHKYKNVNK